MFKFLIRFCWLLIFWFVCQTSFSQDILNSKDLSTIKIDQLSDADILKYQQQLKTSSLSEAQAEAIALSRGLPAAEIGKLRQRVASLNQKKQTSSTSGNTPRTNPQASSSEIKSPAGENKPSPLPSALDPRLFGAELFGTSSLSFQPDLRIATPLNYELGSDDELQLNVFGLQEAAFTLTVSPEGTIYIPNIGMIKVSGMTVEAATSKIRNKMASIAYRSLRTGESDLSITLGKIRSIRITVLGAAKPGTYTISSLSTLYNALYLAGGPAGNGSFRQIELIRNNRREQVIDLYHFLTTGDQSDNVRMRENDVIRITVYDNRVEINGEVKRPGIYEMVAGETLSDLIKFANGFSDNAYKAAIQVIQTTDKDKKIKDLAATEFNTYKPQPSDVFNVQRILNRFQNRIKISGAVFRPGDYELTPGLTIQQLISRADGLKEDVYLERALLYRLKDDLTKELISFNLRELLKNKSPNIELRKNDEIIINSISDIRDEYSISVSGAVRKPGAFPFRDSIQIRDLILMAGGLKDNAFTGRAILTRTRTDNTAESFNIPLDSIVSGKKQDIFLKERDALVISSTADLSFRYNVSVYGAVRAPGSFSYSDRLTLKSLILKAGGFTDMASLKNIEIARRRNYVNPNDPRAKLSDVVSVVLDTFELSIDEHDFSIQPFDIVTVKTNPYKKAQEVVNVEGQVLYPGPYTILTRQERISSILKRAGGLLIEANISGARLRRTRKVDITQDKKTVEKISKQVKDSTGLLEQSLDESYDFIALDLNAALQNTGGSSDIYLQEGDNIIIPRKDEMVNVEGEVLHPVKLAYHRKPLKYYINAAGGFVSSANKNKVFVVYANGKAARTKKILFVRNYPSVKEGSQVFVPKYIPQEKVRKSTAETLGIASAIAGLAAIILGIIQLTK